MRRALLGILSCVVAMGCLVGCGEKNVDPTVVNTETPAKVTVSPSEQETPKATPETTSSAKSDAESTETAAETPSVSPSASAAPNTVAAAE